tara:strand:- start:80 stop:184 length:105 start_codon:yes stop_codon:yes gene_type:complete
MSMIEKIHYTSQGEVAGSITSSTHPYNLPREKTP